MISAYFILAVFVTVFGLREIYADARNHRENAKRHYDFRETISNLCISNLTIFKWLSVVPVFVLYNYLFQLSRPWHLSWPKTELVTWLIAFVVADFIFYWFHVLAHRWNILWAGHLVHHQPTYFNLSIAGRTGVFERSTLFIMALPVALTGLPPVPYFSAAFMGLAYMGWTHTPSIGRLGFLEYFLNTPHHHKLHHHKDLSRIGGTKNFGGIFIIWDRIFGTFWEEKERGECEFGIEGTPATSSPLKCQTFFYRHLFKLFFKIPAKDRLRLLFSHYLPEPLPPEATESPAPPGSYSYYDWLFCISLLVLTHQCTSLLTLGLTLRLALAESKFDAVLFAKLIVACGATYWGLFQISKVLYEGKKISAWSWINPLLAVATASLALALISQEAVEGPKKSVLDFILGSRILLALGALISLRQLSGGPVAGIISAMKKKA